MHDIGTIVALNAARERRQKRFIVSGRDRVYDTVGGRVVAEGRLPGDAEWVCEALNVFEKELPSRLSPLVEALRGIRESVNEALGEDRE
jgi:hypothetical protein